MRVSVARMAGARGRGYSILQGPLGSYSSHVCASSFRICLLAGACAVQVCCFFFSSSFVVMSRNTHNSLQARLFAGDDQLTAEGSSSSPAESSSAGGTSLPSTATSAMLVASAVPVLSPEMISLITQTVRVAMAAAKTSRFRISPSVIECCGDREFWGRSRLKFLGCFGGYFLGSGQYSSSWTAITR